MDPPPKKRWLRFSLITMLVVVTIACVLAGWKVGQAGRQKKVVAWVKKTGGDVCYDYEFDDAGDPIAQLDKYANVVSVAEAPGPTWLREMIGLDYFATVVYVVWGNSEVDDLSPLTNLRAVTLLSVEYSGTDLSPLAELMSLEWLMLSGESINDLSPIAELTKLQTLSLYCPSNSDLTPLVNLTELESLDLRGTPTTDEEIAELQSALPDCVITR